MEISRWRSMHTGMAIDASRDGDRYIPGWRSMHSCMVIIASRDGDLDITSMHPVIAIAVSLDGYRFHPGMASWYGDCSILGWRSIHPGTVIDESRDGDRCIPGLRLMHPWMAIVTALDGVAASLDGDHASQDVYHCIPGWRSMNLEMASRDGDLCTPGRR